MSRSIVVIVLSQKMKLKAPKKAEVPMNVTLMSVKMRRLIQVMEMEEIMFCTLPHH